MERNIISLTKAREELQQADEDQFENFLADQLGIDIETAEEEVA